MNLNFYLFENFETLDLFGPVEVLCRLPDAVPEYFSMSGGIIKSSQNTQIVTKPLDAENIEGIFLIPGGAGTRPLVKDEKQLALVKMAAEKSLYCLSVCTGSAVLAACGLLDGKTATSNKIAFDWVKGFGHGVDWQRSPRFCKDGKFYTSAGVSAGIDMAFEFVRDVYGHKLAEKIKHEIEYNNLP